MMGKRLGLRVKDIAVELTSRVAVIVITGPSTTDTGTAYGYGVRACELYTIVHEVQIE